MCHGGLCPVQVPALHLPAPSLTSRLTTPRPMTLLLQATQHFQADFTDEGFLTIRGCRRSNAMSYTQLPETRRWPAEW